MANSPSTTSLEKLTLPIFIGTLLNWAFFGVLVLQVCIYYAAFPKDRAISKILVAFILVVEIAETLANTRDSVRIFSIYWGNMEILDEVGWAWFSTPIIGSISAAVGQGYFAWRIHIIGRNAYVLALIVALTVVQLGAGVWSGVEICLAKQFSQLQTSNVRPTATWLAATSLCDLIIVASMVFYLLRSCEPEFKRTQAIVSRIIKITVETGLLCALFAIVDLYLFATYKGTNYHLALCIELSKVYSNSVLAILNSRVQLGRIAPKEINIQFSDLVFKSGTRNGIVVEINHDTLGLGSSVQSELDGNASESNQSV
ncbi:hypothetical protein GGX14DRAFT_669639 [Mycena pura]|uniref:DUF6534 domain-containing protein n=1 Tax=Mycena pura TaxID=153505 RepID=A0AAD6VSE7_9AGAR|nr:hypothetical protein GGX14DRAFT_669639 [Mycena pura]